MSKEGTLHVRPRWRVAIGFAAVVVVGATVRAQNPCFEAFVLPAGATPSTLAGSAVALTFVGDVAWCAMGAPLHDQSATDAGLVALFRRGPIGGWTLEQTLVPSSPQVAGRFGESLAALGDLLVIGELSAGVPASGIGAASLYRAGEQGWSVEASLSPPDAAFGDLAGAAVALGTAAGVEWLAVGSPGDDDLGASSGAVSLWRHDRDGWTFAQKVLAPDGDSNDNFGATLGLSGKWLVVGAPKDEPAGLFSGSAYVFELVDGTWTDTTKLLPMVGQPFELFGGQVAIAEDTIAVSAIEGHVGTGTPGYVQLYWHDGASWTIADTLSFAAGTNDFGWDVAAVAHDGAIRVLASSGAVGLPRLYTIDRGQTLGVVIPPLGGAAVPGALVREAGVALASGSGLVIACGVPIDDLPAFDGGSVRISSLDGIDCDADGVDDGCELGNSSPLDCDLDRILDACAIEAGIAPDVNANAVPDACEGAVCPEPPAHSISFGSKAAGLNLGAALAIQGNRAVFGMPGYDRIDNPAPGLIGVFERTPPDTLWIPTGAVLAPSGALPAGFGRQLDLDGDRLAVLDGVDGATSSPRQVWAFDRDEGTFVDPVLVATIAAAVDNRAAVRVAGDRIIVGNARPMTTGALTIYHHDGTGWLPEANFIGDTASTELGSDVDLDGDWAAAGAVGHDEGAASNVGAVHIYRRSDEGGVSTWSFHQRLLLPDYRPNDALGAGVAIDGEWLAVAARARAVPFRGNGTIEIFRLNGDTWTWRQRLSPPDAMVHNGMQVVRLSGPWMVAGAPFDDAFGTTGTDAGAAWLLVREEETFRFVARLAPNVDSAGNNQGAGVAVVADGGAAMVLVGAPGVDDPAFDAGRVLVYALGATDCDGNGREDACELLTGTAFDRDGDGVLDACRMGPAADLDGNGVVDGGDLSMLLAAWGECGEPCPADLDGDGAVGSADLGLLLGQWW